MTNRELGRYGENVTCQYLEEKGYGIIGRNFKCQTGEIDIIAKEKEEIVFVEVKTRCSRKYGEPREAVDKIKRKHIKKAAEFYVCKNQLENQCIRFDVIEVYWNKNQYSINHIKNTLW